MAKLLILHASLGAGAGIQIRLPEMVPAAILGLLTTRTPGRDAFSG